jgi:intein-encoded DNA endonuclease-like protein
MFLTIKAMLPINSFIGGLDFNVDTYYNKCMRYRKLTIQQHAALIRDFNRGVARKKLCKKYNLTHQTLYNYASKEIRAIPTRSDFTLIHNYFEKIDSEAKAYWLGFLYADGNLSQEKYGHVVRIGVAIKDQKHVKAFFQKELCTSNKPTFDKIGCVHFNVHSQQLHKDLKALGCMPAKTFKLKFPELPKPLISHFVRGYFDGDGCITNNGKTAAVEFIGTKNMLKTIQSILHRNDKLRAVSKNGKIVCFWIGSTSGVQNVYEYLYTGATVFLSRKKTRFEELLN